MRTQREKRNDNYQVKSENMDECVFFLAYLYKKRIINNKSTGGFEGPSSICAYVNEELDRYFNYDDERRIFICDMLYNLPVKILTEDDIEWFISDNRACFWLWSELYCVDKGNIDIHPLKTNPGNHKKRCEEIIRRLDRAYSSRHFKLLKLDVLKSIWSGIFNIESFLNYLPVDDSDICDYVWKYLSAEEYGINRIYSPLNQEERYLSIMNYFDFVIDPVSDKRFISGRIKSALDQRKHRQKKQSEGASKRFYIKKENADKLKKVLLIRRMSVDEYFNDVIERDYSDAKK